MYFFMYEFTNSTMDLKEHSMKYTIKHNFSFNILKHSVIKCSHLHFTVLTQYILYTCIACNLFQIACDAFKL